jgi:GT2 family glycosyltransferase
MNKLVEDKREPVCIITTAWNQVDKTLDCLETIRMQDYKPISVLLVNNGSTDNTVERVTAQFPEVEIIDIPDNLGPTRGYNVGFRWALDHAFNYIFLVNNDTLLAPDCVRELVQEAETSTDIGLLMPKIYYADEPQRIWNVGGWENRWNLEATRPGCDQLDTGQWSEPIDIDDAPFCAVMLTRQVLESVGLPDQDYFLYYEDRDFSRRVQKGGFRLRLVPAAHMWHAVSTSSGGSDSPSERYWMARSSVLFFRKNNDNLARWLIIIPWRTASALKTSTRLVRKGKMDSLKAYWQGLWDGVRGVA